MIKNGIDGFLHSLGTYFSYALWIGIAVCVLFLAYYFFQVASGRYQHSVHFDGLGKRVLYFLLGLALCSLLLSMTYDYLDKFELKEPERPQFRAGDL